MRKPAPKTSLAFSMIPEKRDIFKMEDEKGTFMEEEKTEVKSEGQDPEVKEDHPSETEEQPKDNLEEIKEAYEAKLKKVEEEADKAKKQYETDLAKRNKMIADLIGNETPAPVSDSFEKVIKARETNKRL